MKMRYKLSEIFDLQMGKTPARNNPKYWEGGTNPWISIADMSLNGKYIDTTKECITDCAVKETGIKPIFPGTVIMSFKLSVGKVAHTTVKSYSNEAIMSFEIKDSLPFLLDNDYVYYLISSLKFENIGNKAVMGKTLNKDILKNTYVNIHEWKDQIQIVSELDNVTKLIDLCKKQLLKLDELVKSRFIELFGDPLKNDKVLPTVSGETLFKLSNGKALPNSKRFAEGIPAYGGNGISWYTDEILCDYDTIIVGRVGFQSGNVHLAKAPLWVTDNAMYISNINSQVCDIRFLCALMEHIDFTRYQDAGDLKKITQKPFMQMQYLMPPMSLQRQYIAFVEQTDKSKLALQKSLDVLETLKKSLMQKYFG